MPFHVTDKGNSGVCRVNLSNPKSTGCPFGGVDEHFETREGANAYAEGVHKPFLDVTTYDVGDVGRGLDLMAGRSWRYIHTGLSDAEAGKLNEALNGTKLLSQRDAISLSDAVEKAIESQQKEEQFWSDRAVSRDELQDLLYQMPAGKTKLTPHMMQLLEDLRLRDIRLKLIARANGDRSQALSPTDVEAAEQVINDAHCDDEEPADNVRGGIAHLRAAQEFLQASAEKQAKAAGDEARAVEAKVLNRGKLKRD